MIRELINKINAKQADKRKEKEDGVSQEFAFSNQESFAKPIPSVERAIAPDIRFKQCSIELEGGFTNSYEIILQGDNNFQAKVVTSPKDLALKRRMLNNPEAICGINAGFFFFADVASHLPIDGTFNLCVGDGKIVGLPCVNRPALLVSDGKLTVREIRARGKISIGDKKIRWHGAHSKKVRDGAVLYNSACCMIEHRLNDRHKEERFLRDDVNTTPRHSEITDMIVRANTDGQLIVAEINTGGGSDFFAGNFILQMKNDLAQNIRLGDSVVVDMLDDLELSSIQSAVTIGPKVNHFANESTHQINTDKSLGSHPPFRQKRMARSIIYQDMEGDIHLRIFDGAPKTKNFQGVTPREAAELIGSNVRWAYHLDPGQSAKLAVSTEEEVQTYSNEHYLRLPKRDQVPALWTPKGSRPTTSALLFFRNKQLAKPKE